MSNGMNNRGGQPFWTRDAILALALMDAGCKPIAQSPSSEGRILLPCINRYDEDMIFTHGGGWKDNAGNVVKPSRYANMQLFDAAVAAWKDGMKGDVMYGVLLTKEATGLIKAYRDQAKLIDEGEGTVYEMMVALMEDVKAGAVLIDEGIVRAACVILKTRRDYVMQWQKAVPLLFARRTGQTRQFESSVVNSEGKSVRADAFSKPGFKTVFLNVGPKRRKELGF